MIELTYHGIGFDKLRRSLDPKILDKALQQALQKTAMKVRTQISKDVRTRFAIKAGDIGRAVKIIKQTGKSSARVITYTGGVIGLEKFGAGPKKVKTARGPRRGVTVRIRKDRGRKLVPHAFLHNSIIFARDGQGRTPISRLSGPSIPSMVSNQKIVSGIEQKVNRELPVEFGRAMDRFLNRIR